MLAQLTSLRCDFLNDIFGFIERRKSLMVIYALMYEYIDLSWLKGTEYILGSDWGNWF